MAAKRRPTRTGCSCSIAINAVSFGQPRFSKPFNQQLRVCLSAPTHPRGYCEGGLNLEQTRRRLASLGIASEMSESGRETRVSSPKGGGLTKGFLPGDEGLVKSAELNKGIPYPDKRMEQGGIDRAYAHGALKASDRVFRQPRKSKGVASAVPCVK